MPASSRSLGGGISYVAGGTIAPSRFVKLSQAAAWTVLQADSGNGILGVMQEGQRNAPGLPGSDTTIAAIAGDAGTFNIYQAGDKCRIELLVAVGAGQALKASTGGKAIAHTSGSADIGGFAMTDGATGDFIEMLVMPGTFTPNY